MVVPFPLIADFKDEIAEIEVNPLAVLERGKGAVALDCAIVRRNDR